MELHYLQMSQDQATTFSRWQQRGKFCIQLSNPRKMSQDQAITHFRCQPFRKFRTRMLLFRRPIAKIQKWCTHHEHLRQV